MLVRVLLDRPDDGSGIMIPRRCQKGVEYGTVVSGSALLLGKHVITRRSDGEDSVFTRTDRAWPTVTCRDYSEDEILAIVED